MRIDRTSGRALAALTALLLAAVPSAHAVDSCKVKVDPKTGAIRFSGKNVGSVLLWGDRAAQPSNFFANDDTCIVSGVARNCELGTPGTPEQIVPPDLCTLFVRDLQGASCSVRIKGCTPGARPGVAAAGTAKAGVVAFCSALANDVEILRSFNTVNTSAITIDDGTLSGRCEITFPFNIENRFYSVEPIGIVGSTTFKVDYSVDGNTMTILRQQYLPPVWAGFGGEVSVLIY
jgi:hypothetical protein